MNKFHYTAKNSDCSPTGIVKHSRYIEWINESDRIFLKNSGCSIHSLDKIDKHLVTGKLNITSNSVCYSGDQVMVEVEVEKVTPKSFTIKHKAVDLTTKRIVFEASRQLLALNNIDMVTLLPDELVNKIKNLGLN